MGDHRASIRIKVEFHGKEYDSGDWWINFSPDSCGCDERVCEFFKGVWEDGYTRYRQEIYVEQKEQREKQEKENDLAELKRLKEKYETLKGDAKND